MSSEFLTTVHCAICIIRRHPRHQTNQDILGSWWQAARGVEFEKADGGICTYLKCRATKDFNFIKKASRMEMEYGW